MRIIRVFPRRTKATPTDDYAFYSEPGLFVPEADEVHVSVTFVEDIPEADRLARAWRHIAPVRIGGPAFAEPSGAFVPGMYLKPGYVITSRGCPNRCWFCNVWRREGNVVRELPITDGWNVLDDNILATSADHFARVCEMLSRQPQPVEFTGGLEAARLSDWHIEKLCELRPKQMFFAYDTPNDYEPLVDAGRRLISAGFGWRECRCYVLIGYPGDTIADAAERLESTVRAGFMPMAMLYSAGNEQGRPIEWKRFQREWARPAIIARRYSIAEERR